MKSPFILTNPHPITVFSIYAPSTVEDSTEDQSRKEHFWSHLDSIISERSNSSHLIILGDFNARLDSSLDHDHDHIGPQVWGKRQSISDPDTDNAVYLMEFMQSHLLLLPQTYSDLPSSKLVSYKEMTSATDFLDDLLVSDWTTLDFASVTHPVLCDFQFKGSRFQQLINARHLPLIFSYASSFVPQAPTRSDPKFDFSRSADFYEAVEPSLLASTNNSTCSLARTTTHLIAYTDGSCPNNRTVGPDNRAGWGFALHLSTSYTGTHSAVDGSWICSHGQVKNSPLDENILNPVDGSNNTGEMRAVVELFDYILYYSGLPHGSAVAIHIDSTYVIRSLRGDQPPSTHHQLVELAQQHFFFYHERLIC